MVFERYCWNDVGAGENTMRSRILGEDEGEFEDLAEEALGDSRRLNMADPTRWIRLFSAGDVVLIACVCVGGGVATKNISI